jgi:hypothetical protein
MTEGFGFQLVFGSPFAPLDSASGDPPQWWNS